LLDKRSRAHDRQHLAIAEAIALAKTPCGAIANKDVARTGDGAERCDKLVGHGGSLNRPPDHILPLEHFLALGL
jgi:hypothetical protein